MQSCIMIFVHVEPIFCFYCDYFSRVVKNLNKKKKLIMKRLVLYIDFSSTS